MMYYVVICVALALAGVTGMQFFYLAYLEKMSQSQKRRITELERHSERLTIRLYEAEAKLSAYTEFEIPEIEEVDDETWAEIIEDDIFR